MVTRPRANAPRGLLLRLAICLAVLAALASCAPTQAPGPAHAGIDAAPAPTPTVATGDTTAAPAVPAISGPATASEPPSAPTPAPSPAPAVINAGGWTPLVGRLAADGLDKATLARTFSDGAVTYSPEIMARKVDAMVRKKFEPRPKPSHKTLTRSNYRHFLSPTIIDAAALFVGEHKAAFDKAEREYGPPPELIAAFLVVETNLGSFLGNRDALSVLASLARSSQLDQIAPYMKTLHGDSDRAAFAAEAAKDRSQWAYQELAALLRYAAAKKQAPAAIPGSIYGAIGICQFMPSNALRYGVDADGDGVIDLFCPSDAIVSVASYLRGHGWKPGMTEAETKAVVYAYNHSDLYVLAVMTVADRIGARLR
ncbi:Membrane-bound lytic murein transglycosylase B-like protein [Solidesulfovibrio fructosivorans JJ]]|uniref:Membrane-bound lytic murein transglycosylase B-like protein n=1 Tax=Solidesulfovibrio fructosivorans JJ] TaxID=596151 RepID=E1JS71_SOLFR|nr:lytic murein transglycosylase [Solidesulfovibrio fructosivorans]EFL52840.1 Membrane-bound lytic murein transglycosylase B-like protein [Solidesulfovibrio fructosivorans JJ]]